MMSPSSSRYDSYRKARGTRAELISILYEGRVSAQDGTSGYPSHIEVAMQLASSGRNGPREARPRDSGSAGRGRPDRAIAVRAGTGRGRADRAIAVRPCPAHAGRY